jgi:beta-aspartyl-peptidase (threonine type)
MNLPVLALHGGAGTLRRSLMSAADEARYRDALHAILADGAARLQRGECALDVVTEAVRQLEECELFNAGKGAVYTAAGTHELDASVMDGATLRAGAVAGLARTRNPVLAARAVLERGEHLLFAGPAADAYAAAAGLEQVDNAWFGTPARLAQLHAAQAAAAGAVLDHDGQAAQRCGKFGTVGAVALDAQGHLAAATSTGGMTNKKAGRVGDSPLIGAGCYADDASCAVSCTGTGEAFIRLLAAHEISALMRHRGLPLAEAAAAVIARLPTVQGDGGLVAVSARGEVAMPFNTEGMYRGWVRAGGEPRVGIYASDASC